MSLFCLFLFAQLIVPYHAVPVSMDTGQEVINAVVQFFALLNRRHWVVRTNLQGNDLPRFAPFGAVLRRAKAHCRARQKVAWIHTDYSRIQVNVVSETAMWDAYDYIASISNSVTDSFLRVFPALAEKIILIENVLPAKLVSGQANAFPSDQEMTDNGIRLLSIGRYDYLMNKLASANLPDLREYNWTLALIAFKEDESAPVTSGPVPLVVDESRLLYTNYQTFVQALINQGEPSLDAFRGEFISLNNETVNSFLPPLS